MPFFCYQLLFATKMHLWQKVIHLQHHCNYLKLLRRYKNILTALLLALYTFIATPVSLWHHHKADSSVLSSNEKAIKATTKNGVEVNCTVCQHHYSVFDNDAITYFQNLVRPIQSFNTFYSFSCLPITAYSKLNKGPPAHV